jgi:hypothetical protein
MIERIQSLSTNLYASSFAKLEVFRQREIRN